VRIRGDNRGHRDNELEYGKECFRSTVPSVVSDIGVCICSSATRGKARSAGEGMRKKHRGRKSHILRLTTTRGRSLLSMKVHISPIYGFYTMARLISSVLNVGESMGRPFMKLRNDAVGSSGAWHVRYNIHGI
jgi:hypothetical protein